VRPLTFAFAALALTASPAVAQDEHAAHGPDPALIAALADPARAEDAARDKYRHPAETLAFFGVEPGQTVVDFIPGGGWYTRVLVPYLGPRGTYVAVGSVNPGAAGEARERQLGFAQRFAEGAAEWNGKGAAIRAITTAEIPEDLAGKADHAIVMREFHNMVRSGALHSDLVALRKLLKPGGTLGVVEHRSPPDAPYARTDGSAGYMRERDVIALLDAYGFDLVAKSEINANPADPADWPGGVWTLPPSLRGATGETRARLLEVGESDRMTLLFRKRD
jgi:predicted methyltransferase